MPRPTWLLALLLCATAACGPTDRGSGGDGEADGGTSDGGSGADGGADAGPADPCAFATARLDTRPLPRDIRAAASNVAVRVTSGPVAIYARTTSTLTAEQIEQFRTRTCRALQYDLQELAVDFSGADMDAPVRVVVLDTQAYNVATEAPGTYGVAFAADQGDSDAIVLPQGALGNLPELDDTLAHELDHVVTARRAPNDLDIPWYAIEGMAIVLGTRWGRALHDFPTGFSREWLVAATGADARLTWQRYDAEDLTQNLSQLGHDQSLGGFFVEYLRVKHPVGDGQGFPDALVRMLAAMQDCSDGDTWASAFASHWDGLTLAQAKTAFEQFLEATKGDEAARFGGTVWE